MTYTYDDWNKLGASERMLIHSQLIDKVTSDEAKLTKTVHFGHIEFWLAKELMFGDSHFCERCDQNVHDALLFEAHDDEVLAESPERTALENLGIEWACCAQCIEDDKKPVCANCGGYGWQSQCVKIEWIREEGKEPGLSRHEWDEHRMIPNPKYLEESA